MKMLHTPNPYGSVIIDLEDPSEQFLYPHATAPKASWITTITVTNETTNPTKTRFSLAGLDADGANEDEDNPEDGLWTEPTDHGLYEVPDIFPEDLRPTVYAAATKLADENTWEQHGRKSYIDRAIEISGSLRRTLPLPDRSEYEGNWAEDSNVYSLARARETRTNRSGR